MCNWFLLGPITFMIHVFLKCKCILFKNNHLNVERVLKARLEFLLAFISYLEWKALVLQRSYNKVASDFTFVRRNQWFSDNFLLEVSSGLHDIWFICTTGRVQSYIWFCARTPGSGSYTQSSWSCTSVTIVSITWTY